MPTASRVIDRDVLEKLDKMPDGDTWRCVCIGIDPGASGGLAIAGMRTGGRLSYVKAIKMPDTERDVWEWFKSACPLIARETRQTFAVIEKVSGFAGDVASGGNGPAMFKFGQSYGSLRMALVAAGVPFDEVTPQTWQRALGVAPRNKKADESKTAFKNRLKAKAQQLFPDVAVTFAIADALLIAEYCRRVRTGTLDRV